MSFLSDYYYVAKAIDKDISDNGFSRKGIEKDVLPEDYWHFIINNELKRKAKSLFDDGHYARAVEEAYKLIENVVKRKTGLEKSSLFGQKLMNHFFSEQKPLLLINTGSNQTELDERSGYRELFVGSMTGIRNPRAHDSDYIDSEMDAFRLLVFADHLLDIIEKSSVSK